MTYKKIKKVFTGQRKREGAGVWIYRIFDRTTIEELDPFLLLDFFNTGNYEEYKGGFPWHPHRGIETITYLLEGEVYHEDTLKNKGSIKNGEAQWMVSGNGIIHQELMIESPYFLGIQIWLNMSREDKMKNPKYRDLTIEDITLIKEEGFEVRILAGNYKGNFGPVRKDKIKPSILDFKIEANKSLEYKVEENYTIFVFIIDGEGIFNNKRYSIGNGILYEREKGNKIKLEASEEGLRAIVLTGKPLKEPVAWEGPIVMNSKDELDLAFEQLEKQEFITYRGGEI